VIKRARLVPVPLTGVLRTGSGGVGGRGHKALKCYDKVSFVGSLFKNNNSSNNRNSWTGDSKKRKSRRYAPNERKNPIPFMFGSNHQVNPDTNYDGYNKNAVPPAKRSLDDRDQNLTRAETFSMALNQGDVAPFMTIPRVSSPNMYEDSSRNYTEQQEPKNPGRITSASPSEGWAFRQQEDDDTEDYDNELENQPRVEEKRRPRDRGDEGDGPQRPLGAPDDGEKPKFRRNVPPYYKVFELNSRFFLSGLGLITLVCIFFNIVALICAVESDPDISTRSWSPHMHIFFLSVVLIILLVKYALYFFYCFPLNRKWEIAHILFFLVLLTTSVCYWHWHDVKLPEIHDPLRKKIACKGSEGDGGRWRREASTDTLDSRLGHLINAMTANITDAMDNDHGSISGLSSSVSSMPDRRKDAVTNDTDQHNPKKANRSSIVDRKRRRDVDGVTGVFNVAPIPRSRRDGGGGSGGGGGGDGGGEDKNDGKEYLCGLIKQTYKAGTACLVFSIMLLCGLLANVIHAFLGISNEVDITS